MKIFFDTNVLIAAFVARGICWQVFDHCIAEHTICVSSQVLEELQRNLAGKFRFSEDRVKSAMQLVRKKHLLVEDTCKTDTGLR